MRSEVLSRGRPHVYDYERPCEFLSDLLVHYKAQGSFSLRQRTSKVPSCSQALVSQILKGHRQLNRGNLPSVALVFKLTASEYQFLDGKLSSRVHQIESPSPKVRKERPTKNHLLSDWLHPYVKDLVNLQGFELEAETLFSMLKGLAPAQRIKKSVEFLLREGFWRRTPTGQVLAEEDAVVTTNEIPNEKIRMFHKKALEVAMRGISVLPAEKRKASTVLISVNQKDLEELRSLVDSFQNQLLHFIEEHPEGEEALVQVAIHLTPVAETIR
jgi:hypothetical protein